MNLNLSFYEIDDLYKKTCEELLNYPEFISTPRGMKIHEFVNAKLTLMNPRSKIITSKHRNYSTKYFAGELCFYLAGSNSLDFIAHYGSFWRQVSDDNKTVNSCYGKRLMHDENNEGRNQVGYAVDCLLKDKDSRKAVMMIYNPNDAKDSKDNPCTVFLQAFIRDNELILTAHMRSNDIWLGTPYDIGFFTTIQEIIYITLQKNKYVDLKLGRYIHEVGSLHMYERNFEKAKLLTEELNPIDAKIILKYSETPPITAETIKEFPTLLEYEECKRTGTEREEAFYAKDQFIQQIMSWLD